MKPIKLLHTADCHIVSGSTKEINVFSKAVELCKSEKVDLMIIAGDLFDTPFPSLETVSEVKRKLSQIPGTIVAICSGNHDFACENSVYRKHSFPENTVLFLSEAEKIVFPEKNLCLYGAGFCEKHLAASLMENIKADDESLINIGILHGDLVSDLGESVYNPVTSAQIERSRLDYLALGHIHKHTDILKSGSTFYAYSGSPQSIGFDPSLIHGVYLGTIQKGSADLSYVELSPNRHIAENVNISGCESTPHAAEIIEGALNEKYGENLTQNVYTVSLCGGVSPELILNTKRIESILSEKGIVCRVADNSELSHTEIEAIARETSLRGIFAKKLLEKISSSPPGEAPKYTLALKYGLKAFNSEVTANDY